MMLTVEILEACYRAGAFPMADDYGRIEFYRSDPRSVLEFEDLRVSKSLRRVIRKGVYEVRVDEDFEGVVRACADREETWINAEIVAAFTRLHRAGKAHSVEAYREASWSAGSTASPWAGRSWASRCSAARATRPRCASSISWGACGSAGTSARLPDPERPPRPMGAKEIPGAEYDRRLRQALLLDRSFA
jgi:leucyl/phenylalanyl-tRNA--protein transferase